MNTLDLQVQNTRNGAAWHLGQLVTTIELETTRIGTASCLTFTLEKDKNLDIPEGSIVSLIVDGAQVFYGHIFKRSVDRWGEMQVTAYDQLIYLKANESYVFENMTAADVIRRIADDFELNVGELEDTGYSIPYLVREDKSCFDTISYVVNQITLNNTGLIYNFYDDNGLLRLTEAQKMLLPVILGERSMMTDYKYETDIESETYNRIKLVRPNKDTGKGDVYIAEDTDTQEWWGLLQLYKKVDENMNDAQIRQQAEFMKNYYNRALETFSFEAIGIVGLRAGNMIHVNLPGLPGFGNDRKMLCDKVKHTFEGHSHTMSVDLRMNQ